MEDKKTVEDRLSELTTDANQPLDFESFKLMERNKKLAMAFVVVLGVAIIVFGFWQMNDILQIPFSGTDEKFDPDAEYVSQTEVVTAVDEEDPAVLRARDTDEDGLNDFDELYIYQTSPYLADTDSDGVNDIDEIKKLEDPTCPIGQNCFRTSELYEMEQAEEIETKEEELKLTAEQIRALLIETGDFSADQVNLFSDSELLSFYEKFLAENPELQEASQVEVDAEPTPEQALTNAKKLNVEEIRNILIDQGLSESEISQIDDETLLQLYQDAFSQAQEKMEN